MISRVLTGYTATKAGRDALALAAQIALTAGAALDVVVVLPAEGRSVITPPDAAYGRHLREQAEIWLADAIATLPIEISCMTYVRAADSVGEGLAAAADEFGASCLVVGAAGGFRKRHRLGTTASELLHTSRVPVVLAPRGFRKLEATGVPRITVGVGAQPGTEATLAAARSFAEATGAAVRLVSLVTTHRPTDIDSGLIRVASDAPSDEVCRQVLESLDLDPEAISDIEMVVAQGDTIADAVEELGWLPGELVFAGSSRLAQPRRVFLGATGARILHALPVPMVVVPRSGAEEG